MPNLTTCQPDRVEAFLSGKLSGVDEHQFTQHLDHCPLCRQQLDEAAAVPNTWSFATEFLKDDPLDRAPLSGLIQDGLIGETFSDEPQTIRPQIKQVLDMLSPTDDPDMLGRLGAYEVSGVIGAGGMGVVLKAFDRALDRTVAIKVMAPHLATSGAARQRFSREARATAAVIHPNVIAIYGVSTDAALPYLVMPYVGGASLQKRLDTDGALPVADVLRIGIQIASGLAAAHEQGLVHRDIKPANILLDQGVERLVITDFGLARAVDDASVTRTGVIAGTPQYMSPEQARGEPVDARSDLLSLGSVLYTACTGRVPFRADSPYGVLRKITDNMPRPIREINALIPVWLSRVVDRLLAKSTVERFQSAEEVARVLVQCLAHHTEPTVHDLPDELSEPRKRRKRSLGMLIGCIALLLAMASGWWVFRKPAATESSKDSATETETTATQEQLGLPWESPASALEWDDRLTPIFQHIEDSIATPTSLSPSPPGPLSPSTGRGGTGN